MDEQGMEGIQSVKPTIINIVSTVNLDCKLDLQSIKLKAPTAEYNPQRHPSVSMRIRAPESKAQINSSGMMVCTGGRSESQSKLAASKYATIIRKMGFPARFKDFKIQEIVGSCDVKFPIRLERLADSHATCSSYTPELFPWLTYQMKEPKIILYIFDSGKVYLKGNKSKDEIYTAFKNIYPVLTEFRKNKQWYAFSSILATFKLAVKLVKWKDEMFHADFIPGCIFVQRIVLILNVIMYPHK